MPHVSAAFDSGNIEVVDASDPGDIRLAIRTDGNAEFFQWFHFRVVGARGVPLTMRIQNAGASSYPKGWEGYRAVVSEDRRRWFRVDTAYDGKELTIRHTPATDSLHVAYFTPYSMERHKDLVDRAQTSPRAVLEVPGVSIQGRDIDLLHIGEQSPGKPNFWLIARQHPGESMAEWFVEGFLDRLLDPADGAARALLDRVALHVVPNLNPDGTALGNLRVNAVGANLNREWAEPSVERSPEVFHVRRRMAEIGVDLCLDAHGDEGLPYNFIAGFDGVPDVSQAKLAVMERFKDAFAAFNPDFQTRHGYPRAAPGKGNLTTSTGHLAHALGAVSMTLEMPFKDAANAPDHDVGWSAERSMALGRSALDAMLAVAGEFPVAS
jgi:murein tripeptide amidase MpaA